VINPCTQARRGADQNRTGVCDLSAETLYGGATWTYFIQVDFDGPIKIGTAADPQERLQTLQTANPHELHLVLTVWAPADLERDLHARLSAHRIRGEWFRPHAEVWNAVADCHDEYVIGRLLEEAAA